ncbi:hypothetical protein [Photobacterium halotolerans]|uniref:DUF2570 domain-containing protein n=1 Tax=Photobacterium halotolerans TaxID=265726 RepID=A0A7X4WDJ4_9GAMM|nr:hypothetical protein [Photobacterium halotolerans]NAW66731.1 hypothetical protein [Photobacterium halotolerans]
MVTRFKTYGLAVLALLLAVVFIDNCLTTRELKAALAEKASVTQQLTQAISVNQSMEQTVAYLEAVAARERLAAEQAAQQRKQWEAKATRARQQIDKDIANAECADLPIPGADRWVYYYQNTGGDAVQNQTD